MPTTTTGLATSFINFSRPGASGGGATTTLSNGRIGWAGHNLLTNSESFDASAWTKTSTTVTANSTVAPDGNKTADTITATSTYGRVECSITYVDATYTLSVFAKKTVSSAVFGFAFSNVGAADEASINLNTGVTASQGANISSVTATSVGDYWRIVAVSTRSAGSGSIRFFSGYPNNIDAVIWGAHLYRSDMQMQLNPAMPAGMQSYYPTTPRNLVGYSEDFSNGYWSRYLLNVTSNVALAPNGLQTADRITFTGQYAYIGSSVSPVTVTGSIVTISVWLKLESGNANLQLRGSLNSLLYNQNITVTSEWQRFSVSFTHDGSNNIGLAVQDRNTSGWGSVLIWGAQLSDSASLDTYVPVYGAAVTSAAYYAPRLDFDPVTLAARGLLVEELRTNLLLYTADFRTTAEAGSTRSWLSPAGATTATVNYAEAPDGTTSATRIVFTASDYPGRSQNVTLEASKPYTFSVWIKRVSGSGSGRVQIEGASVISAVSTIDVSTNWTRYTVTGTSTGAGAATVYIYFEYLAGRTGEYLLWGAQIEQGSFATSYIPNGSAVAGATRTADVASVSTQAFPYSDTTGTVVVNVDMVGASASTANGFFNISDGTPTSLTGASWITAYGDTSVVYSGRRSNNTSATNISSSQSLSLNTPFKVGLAYAVGGTDSMTVNGGTIASQSGVASAYTNSILRLGAFLPGGNPGNINGHIRQITYLPRRISNAELQSRSA